MNFGGHSPKETIIPGKDSDLLETSNATEPGTFTTETATTPVTATAEALSLDVSQASTVPIMATGLSSTGTKKLAPEDLQFPLNPSESVEERNERLEREKREKALFLENIQANQNNTTLFQDISTIYPDDQSKMASKKRKNDDDIMSNLASSNDKNNLFGNIGSSVSKGAIPKISNLANANIANPILSRIEEVEEEDDARRFSSYVATPRRALDLRNMANRRLRTTFYPNEDEPIEQSNVLTNFNDVPERSILNQNYLNERKVSFANPRNVTFSSQPRDQELIQNEGYFPNSYQHGNLNTGNFDNSNMSNVHPSFRQLNSNMPQNYMDYSMRGNTQPRKSFLKRLYDIPKFNGESFQSLTDFVDTCETLFCSVENDLEEREFFEQMMLRLRGEAKNVVTQLENLNWRTIKGALRSNFAYLSNKDILTSQLENLRQEKDESLTKYAERARKLLLDKNSVYSHLTEEQKAEHNRMARKSFAKGVSNIRLRDRLITRGANTLEDAISYAIETENDVMNNISRNELYCGFCRINGHREQDCRSKNARNNDLNKIISALRFMGSPVRRNFNRFDRFNGFNNQNFRRFDNNFGNNRRNFGNFQRNNWNNNGNWSNNNRNWNFNRNNNGNNGNWNRNWNSGNNGNWNGNWNRNGNNGNFNRFDTSNVNNNRNRNNDQSGQSDQNRFRQGQNQRQDFPNRANQFSNNVVTKSDAQAINIVESKKEN
ncbi:homeobox protein 2-like [Sitodiplosis mosellana]|uniref:homeobox protein 2-like n=1 Tax=Sitodiplosis mosellana TaxID=263140 RepID=UPI00244454DF|nr:homeobox protein 2-like [Sitodiplosis mosellana]